MVENEERLVTQLHDSIDTLPDGLLDSCRTMPRPQRVLMCPPSSFDVVDVKNPHMAGQVGAVDRRQAASQWQSVRDAFADCGATVETIAPLASCEDMVFCANQTFTGLDAAGARHCVLGNMKHASRRREVPAFAAWFNRDGYRVHSLSEGIGFEGGGDAVWHPGRGLIWGGHGHRTNARAYDRISRIFDAPVLLLKLTSDRFYHLDTCFCPLDQRSVLVHTASLEPSGVELIRAVFERVIECDADEADHGLACNATAIATNQVVIQMGNPKTSAALRDAGFDVHEIETAEFRKSGGSVFCMKAFVF